MQRALLHPALEQSGYFKELGKEGELPHGGGVLTRVPTYLNTTARGDNAHCRILIGRFVQHLFNGDDDLFEFVF